MTKIIRVQNVVQKRAGTLKNDTISSPEHKERAKMGVEKERRRD